MVKDKSPAKKIPTCFHGRILMQCCGQGLTVAQARSMQEYYDNIDKKDPRSAVAIPKVDDQEISR